MTLMNIELHDARALVALVETGSISRAANELHLTQPAVTRRIQRLEQAIGAALVDRTLRPLTLTEVGRAALERCRRLLLTADEIAALAQSPVMPSREMRIGVAHALTEFALFEATETVRRTHPALVLRFATGWSNDLIARLRNGAFLDAAIVLLPRHERVPNDVEAEVLASEELVIIISKRQRSKRWTLRDLENVGWILNPEGCAARAWLQRELARHRVPLRVAVETYSYELQMSLVARGQGAGLVPSRLLMRSPVRSELSLLRLKSLNWPMRVLMLTRELAPSLQPALTTLADSLRRELGAAK
jgi:DNA-binding transcriptional LysR family regulator